MSRVSVTGTALAGPEHDQWVRSGLATAALHGLGITELTTGGAIGIDTMAARVGLETGIPSRLCFPQGKWWNDEELLGLDWDWIESIPGGYMKRNDALVEHADVLLAFPRKREEKQRSGTWSTIRRARKKGIPVLLFPLEEASP